MNGHNNPVADTTKSAQNGEEVQKETDTPAPLRDRYQSSLDHLKVNNPLRTQPKSIFSTFEVVI